MPARMMFTFVASGAMVTRSALRIHALSIQEFLSNVLGTSLPSLSWA